MKKFGLFLTVVFIFFVMPKTVHAVVYIKVSPPSYSPRVRKIKHIRHIPYLLRQRVDLAGKLNTVTALNLLMRSVSGISLITRHLKNDKPANFYIRRQPLYRALNLIVIKRGYGYSFKKGFLYVFGTESRIFKLPISDLGLNFSSTVGASGMNINQNMNNNSSSMQSGMPGVGTGITGQTGTNGTAEAGGLNSSNLGGVVYLTSTAMKSLVEYLKDNLKVIMKNAEFTIDPKDGIIYLSGPAGKVKTAVKFLNKVKNDLRHMVFLKVEVINVTLNKNFQAGINWNMVFNNAFRSNAAGISSVAIGLPLASNNNISSVPEITFSGSGSNQAVVNALSTQGTVNVLSQPRLMLISGETRVISSGVIQNYVQSVMVQSVGVISSQTETYPIIGQVFSGIGIAFTPEINFKKNAVRVTINFMNNNVNSFQAFSIGGNTFEEPEVSAQSLTDTVVIPSGKTMVIGGILSSSKQKNTYGVPLLQDIPLLGDIFKSVNYTKIKNDLIIMITPVITGAAGHGIKNNKF